MEVEPLGCARPRVRSGQRRRSACSPIAVAKVGWRRKNSSRNDVDAGGEVGHGLLRSVLSECERPPRYHRVPCRRRRGWSRSSLEGADSASSRCARPPRRPGRWSPSTGAVALDDRGPAGRRPGCERWLETATRQPEAGTERPVRHDRPGQRPADREQPLHDHRPRAPPARDRLDVGRDRASSGPAPTARPSCSS